MLAETVENIEFIEESARQFAHQKIRPHFMEWDETQEFPIELMRELGQQGFLGVLVPEEYGGHFHYCRDY